MYSIRLLYRDLARRQHLCWSVAFLLGSSYSSVWAQTTFAWADAKPFNVDRYATVHRCVAFLTRVRDSVTAKAPVARDTLPAFGVVRDDTLPTIVVEHAKQCSAQFPVARVAQTDLLSAMRLYLMANRDRDAETLVQRRMATVADSSALERFLTLDTLMRVYLTATPIRLAVADSLIQEALRIGSSVPTMNRLKMLLASNSAAYYMGDTVREKKFLQLFLKQLDEAKDSDKRNLSWGTVAWLGLQATMQLYKREMIDSLRKGTAAYAMWQQSRWKVLSGEETIGRFPLGKRAPQITGDFWFPASAKQEGRPRTGRVSLIVFLDNDTKGFYRWERIALYAMLHRVASRFPAVEVTLVSQTAGYFDMAAPPNPEEEAKAMQSFWKESFRLPGALAVSTTPFWRLPSPDTRRINQEVTNVKNYLFGNGYISLDRRAFLIDRDGLIVYSDRLDNRHETLWIDIIDALVERDGGSSAN